MITLLCSQNIFAKELKSKEVFVKINGIEIEHTNPSMGPHEKVKTIHLSNLNPHEDQFNKFLKEAKIFTYTFEEYLNAVIKKDQKILSQIAKGVESTDSNQLNQGATISNLTITLKDQPSVRLSDLRYYSFSGYYYDFISYLATKGTSHISSSKYELQEELKPINDIPRGDDILMEDSKTAKKRKK